LNLKNRTRRRVVWFTVYCLLLFLWNDSLGGYLKVHLMIHFSTKFNQTYTQMITWHCSSTLCGPFILMDNTKVTVPAKVANSNSLQLSNLTVHSAYFKPTVGILPNWIKGRKFFSVKRRLPSSNSYK
jgi:hypothetical protein